MRWPWHTRPPLHHTLAISLEGPALHWALADTRSRPLQLLRAGRLPLDAQGHADLGALRALGDGVREVRALLPLSAYQLLQIEAPQVPPDELKAAARWHIRDRVDHHVDDLTLDVLRVGRPASAGSAAGQLFVVATPNTEVTRLGRLAQAARWPLAVIDVTDLAQRNLHSAAAAAAELGERASACLVQHGQACLLSICIGDELYYSRRLDWDPRLAERAQQPRGGAATGEDTGGLDFSFDSPPLPAAMELGAPGDEPSRLVVELQRSFDVWERSWQDWPLAVLLLKTEAHGTEIGQLLQDELGLRVLPLDTTAAVDSAAVPELPAACTALLGALLRQPATEL